MTTSKYSAGSKAASLAAAYDAARDAVIAAQVKLERAEQELAVAAERMLAFIEAQQRHPCNTARSTD